MPMWIWILLIAVAVFAVLFVIGLFAPDEEELSEASKVDIRPNDRGSHSASTFVSSKPGGVSLEEARELQENFTALVATDDVSKKINAAAQLMTKGLFQECINAYEQIMEDHPETTGDCLGNIGAAYFFLEQYEIALDYYIEAKENGADPDMMDDNIEEVREVLGLD